MEFETGKYYKHTKDIYVKVLGKDYRDYVDIQYADGRIGKLIPAAPGWSEIPEKDWKKVEVVKEDDQE